MPFYQLFIIATVEFAIKLQDVLLPIDSHWPVEKYKAIDDAYNANDKEAQAEARKDLAAATPSTKRFCDCTTDRKRKKTINFFICLESAVK